MGLWLTTSNVILSLAERAGCRIRVVHALSIHITRYMILVNQQVLLLSYIVYHTLVIIVIIQ